MGAILCVIQLWKHPFIYLLFALLLNPYGLEVMGCKNRFIGIWVDIKFCQLPLVSPFMVNQCLGQKEDFLFGAIHCDMVWKQRNQALFGDSTLNIDGVSTKISCLFSEHKNSNPSTTR